MSLCSVIVFFFALSVSVSPRQLTDDSCKVTVPNGVAAAPDEPNQSGFGNRFLSTALWENGTIVFAPGGPGFVTQDGALGMKFGWMRAVRGRLTITGNRLDAAAPPLRSEVSSDYGDIGFQASYIIFPTPGCWKVDAIVGNDEKSLLTFVTKVVKVGDGPAWRR